MTHVHDRRLVELLGIWLMAILAILFAMMNSPLKTSAQGPVKTLSVNDVKPNVPSAVNGAWSYRSFVSNPDLTAQPNDLLFGSGTLDLTVANTNELTGTLGGTGWQLQLFGKLLPGKPNAIRFTGKGTIGGEEWVYDYLGYVVPKWENGVEQRPAIVGTIIRTKAHSSGNATAGFVAHWIAVRQGELELRGATEVDHQIKGLEERQNRRNLFQQRQPYPSDRILKQKYLQEGQPIDEANRSLMQIKSLDGSENRTRLCPAEISSSEGRLDVTLNVDYGTAMIGNHQVRLRMYNECLVGPTLRVKAGDTLHITLNNRLPVEPSIGHGMNGHHEWNTTNLHFHGLHVAPQGPPGVPDAESDNVLLSIPPSNPFDPSISQQKYQVKIPDDHVAGTFWYHAHRHGSTTAQVSSGMAGALIVERNGPQHNLDSVPEIAACREEIMLLQAIPYLKDSAGLPGEIERSPSDALDPNANDVRMFGPSSFRDLKRYITVNGKKVPELTMKPGEIVRLRLIHSGQRESVRLRVERSPSATAGPAFLSLHEIAVDGLPTGGLRTIDPSQAAIRDRVLELFPGYRSDVLLKAPNDSGEFYLVDTRNDTAVPRPDTGADGSTELLRWVAKIRVEGSAVSMSLPDLTALAPHRLPDLLPSAVSNTRFAFYGLDLTLDPIGFFISRNDLSSANTPVSTSNAKPYDPSDARLLQIGETDRWFVGSRNSSGAAITHPFHIHVNPFLIKSVKSLVEPGNVGSLVDVTAREIGSPTWRDTLAMKHGYTYELLTRYDTFHGDFVNHCHILDHEDNGMMELVRIQPTTPPAPFSAVNNIESARINSSQGKTRSSVLFFVKGSFCPHCMQQLTEMATGLANQAIDVTVISASTQEDLKSFSQTQFRLVADPELKLFKKFGAFDGEAKHATIVFDSSGNELFRNVAELPFTDSRTLLKAIGASSPARREAIATTVSPKERKNIDDLTAQELAAYKHSISKLQKSTDPLNNYLYHANLHNLFLSTPPHGCEHGNDLFFPWHRWHLANFEKALQASDPDHPTLSTKNVTIPYWNWTKAPTGVRYPKDFENEFDGTNPNPLFTDFRNRDPSSPFFDETYMTGIVRDNDEWNLFAGFPRSEGGGYGALEIDSHNTMHGTFIGGFMANPNEASLDPIYWSFHAFIDYQWDRWQKIHSKPPTSLDEVLRGFREGPTVRQTEKVVDLGYYYTHDPSSIIPDGGTRAFVDTARTINLESSTHEVVGKVAMWGGNGPFSFRVPKELTFRRADIWLHDFVVPNQFSYRVRIHSHLEGSDPAQSTLLGEFTVWKSHSPVPGDKHEVRGNAFVNVTKALKAKIADAGTSNLVLTLSFKPIVSQRKGVVNEVLDEIQFRSVDLCLDGAIPKKQGERHGR